MTHDAKAQEAAVAEQKAAIHEIVYGEQDVAIVAAAGSGKTKVVVEGVQGLLRRGIPASDILLLTFSRAACDEIAARLSSNKAQPKLTAGEARELSTTYAAFTAKTCREYHGDRLYVYKQDKSGPGPKCFDLNTWPSLKEDYWQQARGSAGSLGPLPEDPEGYDPSDSCSEETKKLQLACSLLFSRGINPKSDEAVDWLKAKGYDVRVAQWYARFEALLAQNALWTFDQAIDRCYRDGVPTFSHVIVDEAQDNSWVQLELAKMLAKGGRLILVGDPRQTIHVWRGAAPEVFLDFMAKPTTTVKELHYNWRSTPRVVGVGNEITKGCTWAPSASRAVRLQAEDGVARERDANPIDDMKSLAAANDGKKIAYLARTWKEIEDVQFALLAEGTHRFHIKPERAIVKISLRNKLAKGFSRAQQEYSTSWHEYLQARRRRAYNDSEVKLLDLAEKYSTYAEFEAATLWYFEPAKCPDEPKIYLSTVHSTKGLEYDIVLLQTHDKWPSTSDEERRLFYVACTRAENVLLVYGGNSFAGMWIRAK